MTEENGQLSEVLPYVTAILLCDIAVEEPTTHKKNLLGVFTKVLAGGFPLQHSMQLYARLTDAIGRYDLSVRHVQVSTGEVLHEVRRSIQAPNREEPVELLVPFDGLFIPEAGRYEFQLWANEVFLAAVSFEALSRA